jgi:hypothetical protein
MLLNLFGRDGPPGALAGDYRGRRSIAMVRLNWSFPIAETRGCGLKLEVSAASVVDKAYDGVADGSIEILADVPTRELKSRLSMKGEERYPWMDEQLRAFVP